MCKITILGAVLPRVAKLTVDDLPSVKWTSKELDLEMKFGIQIRDGKISISCELNKWSQADHWMPVYMRALDTVRGIVDLASFANGVGLTVVLDQLVDADGKISHLLATQPSLAALSTSVKNTRPPKRKEDNNFDRLVRLVVTDPSVFRALRDLIDAISDIHVSALACGRAMEGIRHVIAPGVERRQGWRLVNDALRIDRAYLEYITDVSKGPRHADPAHIPGPICVEITRRSWIIMDRFFEYLKRGSQPLPASDFPLLN
jgi:hypothetical protein